MPHKRSRPPFRPSILGSMLALAGFSAMAQTPDAGRLLDTVRERQLPAAPATAPVVVQPPEPAARPAPGNTVKVTVTAFEFTGNTQIDSAALAAELAGYTGRELGYAELSDAAARITALYRSRGFIVARAVLPPQDIQGGRVAIQVQEGVLGEVKVERGRRLRLDAARIDSFVASLRPGMVIREGDIERALLVLTDVPGIVVRSVLRPGKAPGTADLVVQVNEGGAAQAQVGFDNHGSRYTGRNRLLVDVALNDYFGQGEALTLRSMTSFDGLTANTVGASVPLGGSGLRAGVSYTTLGYRLGREFAPLEANGEAEATGLTLSYPLVRGRNANLSVQLAHDRKHFADRVTQATSEVLKSSDVTSLSLLGDWRDSAIGPALTNYSLTYSEGSLSRDSVADAAADAISAQTAGRFSKINWSLARLQSLPAGFTLRASLAGQKASRNLDSSEEFFLGGANGVRAYPQGEAAGDEGVLARLELRKRLGTVRGFTVEGMAFYDAGRVRFDRNAWDPAQTSNERSLHGPGIGLALTRPNMAVSLSLAFPGSGRSLLEPSRSPMVWLQVSGTPQLLNSTRVVTPEGESGSGESFDIYGAIGLQFERVARDSATPAGPRGATQSATPTGNNLGRFSRWTDPTSTLGARGAWRLGQGLSAWWQAEIGISYDYTDRSAANGAPAPNASTSIRDTAIGLRSTSLGSVLYGLWAMPIRGVAGAFDPFDDDSIGAASTIMGSPGFGVGGATRAGPAGLANNADNDDASFIRRQPGVFQYWTPEWKGFSARFAYSNNGRSAAPDVGDGSISGASVTWRGGPWQVMLGYEQHSDYFGVASLGRNNRGVGSPTAVTAGTSSEDHAIRLGVSYDFGATKVAAMVDEMNYAEHGVVAGNTVPDLQSYRRRAGWIGATHTIGRLELRASAGKALPGSCTMISNDPAQQGCSTEGLGATMGAIGFAYKLTNDLTLFGHYAKVQNEASASYNFRVGGVFGAAGRSPGVGADPSGFGIGLKYRF